MLGREPRHDSYVPHRGSDRHSPIGESHGLSKPPPSRARSGSASSKPFAGPTKTSGFPQLQSRSPDELTSLLKAFSQYTTSVVATANLTYQHTQVMERIAKQRTLKDRWRKHYHSFVSLAEDHDRESEKAASLAESYENKLKQNSEVQETAMHALMSSLLVNNRASTTNANETTSFGREIRIIKAELKATKIDLEDTRSDMGYINGTLMIKEMEERIRAMKGYESQMAQMKISLNKLQTSVDQHEKTLVILPNVRDRMEELSSVLVDMNQVKEKNKELAKSLVEQKSDFQTWREKFAAQNGGLSQSIIDQQQKLETLTEGHKAQKDHVTQRVADHQKHLENLSADFSVQQGNLERLNVEITGDPNDRSKEKSKGLIDYIQEGREKSGKFENALRRFDEDLEVFTERLSGMESEMNRFTSRQQQHHALSVEVGSTPNKLDHDSGKRLSALEDRFQLLTDLNEKLRLLSYEQGSKDDIVSLEVERLDHILSNQESTIQALQEELAAVKSELSSTAAQKPSTPPPQPNNQWKPDDSFRLKVEDLESSFRQFKEASLERTDAMEVLVESQQQRFDNLSTDELANNIIHQMQKVYALHPAHITTKFEQIKAKQAAVDQHVLSTTNTVNKLNEALGTLTVRSEHHQRHLGSLEKRLVDVNKSVPDILQNHKIQRELENIAEKHRVLEKKLDESRRNAADTLAEVQRKLNEWIKATSELIDGVEKSVADLKLSSGNRLSELGTKHKKLEGSLSADRQGFQHLCDDFKQTIDGQASSIQNVRSDLTSLISSWKNDRAADTASLETSIKAVQTRLDSVEATLQNMDSLHRSIPLKAAHKSIGGDSPFPRASPRRAPPPRILVAESQPDDSEEAGSDVVYAPQTTTSNSGTQESNPSPASEKHPRKRKRGELIDSNYSSDTDSPVARPVRKSNRGVRLTEKAAITTRLRAHSRSGGEQRS